jgi:prevent-host-death family protein
MALPKTPALETMNVSEARKQFSETLDRVHRREARVVVEKSGIPVGAIVSMDDLEQLKRIDRNRTQLLEAMTNIARHFEDVPEAELEREVEKAIAEVKAERRGQRESSSQLAS